jgi:hypothetical protein
MGSLYHLSVCEIPQMVTREAKPLIDLADSTRPTIRLYCLRLLRSTGVAALQKARAAQEIYFRRDPCSRLESAVLWHARDLRHLADGWDRAKLDEVQAAKASPWPLLFDILAADRSIYSLQNLVGTRLATAKLYAEARAQVPTASTRSVPDA